MQMEMGNSPPMEVTMDIDAEEQKKRAHATTPFAGMTMTMTNKEAHKTQDTKKICNNRTPPCLLKLANIQKPVEGQLMFIETESAPDTHGEEEELIQERENHQK